MASITIVVSKGAVREDKRKRPFVHGQDMDTNQFFTVYAKKDAGDLITSDLVGKTVVFNGTFHSILNIPEIEGRLEDNTMRDYEPGKKLIARTVDVVK